MSVLVAQLAGAVEYTNCTSAEGESPTPMSDLVAQLAGAVEYNDCSSAEG